MCLSTMCWFGVAVHALQQAAAVQSTDMLLAVHAVPCCSFKQARMQRLMEYAAPCMQRPPRTLNTWYTSLMPSVCL